MTIPVVQAKVSGPMLRQISQQMRQKQGQVPLLAPVKLKKLLEKLRWACWGRMRCVMAGHSRPAACTAGAACTARTARTAGVQHARSMLSTESMRSTYSRGSRHLLVAAGVDGADVLEAEVPLQVRLHKGRHKPTTGSIHVDLDIITLQADQEC